MITYLDGYFLDLKYSPIHLIEKMKQEASVDKNYYTSPVGVTRCDVSTEVRYALSKIIKVPFADCGFLKTAPNQLYPPHKDVFRVAAINMPLDNAPDGFRSYIISPTQGIINIKYNPWSFTLLNVMSIHGVENKNLKEERIVLSIGIKNLSYNDLVKMHIAGELLNVL